MTRLAFVVALLALVAASLVTFGQRSPHSQRGATRQFHHLVGIVPRFEGRDEVVPAARTSQPVYLEPGSDRDE